MSVTDVRETGYIAENCSGTYVKIVDCPLNLSRHEPGVVVLFCCKEIRLLDKPNTPRTGGQGRIRPVSTPLNLYLVTCYIELYEIYYHRYIDHCRHQ